MTRRSLWLMGVLGCVMIVGITLLARPSRVQPRHEGQENLPPAASLDSTRDVVLSAVEWTAQAGPSLHASDRVIRTPSDPLSPTPLAEPVRAQQARDWDDPSLDPSMKREPPTPILPPEARPKQPAIEPSQAEWRRMRREDDAVVY